jgi:hypothetical protein
LQVARSWGWEGLKNLQVLIIHFHGSCLNQSRPHDPTLSKKRPLRKGFLHFLCMSPHYGSTFLLESYRDASFFTVFKGEDSVTLNPIHMESIWDGNEQKKCFHRWKRFWTECS